MEGTEPSQIEASVSSTEINLRRFQWFHFPPETLRLTSYVLRGSNGTFWLPVQQKSEAQGGFLGHRVSSDHPPLGA